MTPEEHRCVHEQLHIKLDELVADFIAHTAARPSKATILDLMTWSDRQMKRPDHEPSAERGGD